MPRPQIQLCSDTLIFTYTGEVRRARADAIVRNIAGFYKVLPISFREVGGADVDWLTPNAGEAINAANPLRNHDDAVAAFALWAFYTFANDAPV